MDTYMQAYFLAYLLLLVAIFSLRANKHPLMPRISFYGYRILLGMTIISIFISLSGLFSCASETNNADTRSRYVMNDGKVFEINNTGTATEKEKTAALTMLYALLVALTLSFPTYMLYLIQAEYVEEEKEAKNKTQIET